MSDHKLILTLEGGSGLHVECVCTAGEYGPCRWVCPEGCEVWDRPDVAEIRTQSGVIAATAFHDVRDEAGNIIGRHRMQHTECVDADWFENAAWADLYGGRGLKLELPIDTRFDEPGVFCWEEDGEVTE